MRILQVNSRDVLGGAEAVALNLHRQYRLRGHDAWLGVGRRTGQDANVFTIKNGVRPLSWTSALWRIDDWIGERHGPPRPWLRRGVRVMADPLRWLDQRRGRENFRYPGAWHLPESVPQLPDILHAHNLHGQYFDLRALPALSQRLPVMLTLHDAWLLSGHCAHSFGCERWRTGCGECPDLTIYPAIRRDATDENWRVKRAIYGASRLTIVTPCEWLQKRVAQSMLQPAAVETTVIPYGIDCGIFQPASQAQARLALNLPTEARILLFTANSLITNIWKDFDSIRKAVALLAETESDLSLEFVALGDAAPDITVGRAKIRFVPFQDDPGTVARYYQAADVYVHAARADTFPNSVLEALACGTPVVATAVGGIPEQVDDGCDGFLTPPGDAAALAAAIRRLLRDDALRTEFGRYAAHTARRRFNLERHAGDYLSCYEQAIEEFKSRANVSQRD